MVKNKLLCALFLLVVSCGGESQNANVNSIVSPKDLGFVREQNLSMRIASRLGVDIDRDFFDENGLSRCWFMEDQQGLQALFDRNAMNVLELFLQETGYSDYSRKKEHYRNYIWKEKSTSAQLRYDGTFTHLIIVVYTNNHR